MNTEAKIRDWFMNLVARIVRGHKIRQNQKRFKQACKLAIGKHRADAKTYYVIQGDGIYKVWNSAEILMMKRQGAIKKNVNCLDLLSISSYVASSNRNLKTTSLNKALAQEFKRISEVY